VGIADVIGPYAAVEVRTDENVLGLPGARDRRVFVHVVRAVSAAPLLVYFDWRHGQCGYADRMLLIAYVHKPYQLGPIRGIILHGFIADDHQIAAEQGHRGMREALEWR